MARVFSARFGGGSLSLSLSLLLRSLRYALFFNNEERTREQGAALTVSGCNGEKFLNCRISHFIFSVKSGCVGTISAPTPNGQVGLCQL